MQTAATQKDFRRTVLVWHVHGSWTEAFVAGPRRYLVPVAAAGEEDDARGLMGRNWPRAQEVPLGSLRERDIDLVVLQRAGGCTCTRPAERRWGCR